MSESKCAREITYFPQETVYTCGPAVMRMLLTTFGFTYSESELALKLESNAEVGTTHSNMIKLTKELGLSYQVKQNAKLTDLEAALNSNMFPIVNFQSRDKDGQSEGHFAIVTKVDSENIYLCDPFDGPNTKLRLAEFEFLWWDDEGERGWFMAIGFPDL